MQSKSRLSHYVPIILLTWLATALRFYKLGAWGFWIDELFTFQNAINIIPMASSDIKAVVAEHPVTSSLIFIATNLFGTSEWGVRFAPAMIGSVTIPLLYVPLKRIFNSHVALVTMVFLAISPWHIYWSQNARFYVLMLLFYTFALFALYFGMVSNQKQYFLYTLLFAGLAVSERLLGLLIIPVAFIIFITSLFLPEEKPNGLHLKFLLIFVVVSLLFGGVFGWQFLYDPSRWADIYFQSADKTPWKVLRQFLGRIGVVIVGFGGIGGLYFVIKRELKSVFFFVSGMVVPLLIMIGALFQFVNVRYMFVSLISWYVLVAVTAVNLIKNITKKETKLLLTFIIGVLLIIEPIRDIRNYVTSVNGNRNNWKAAFVQIHPLVQDNDLVVSSVPLVGEYYLEKEVLGMKRIDPRLEPQSINQENRQVWFIIGGKTRVDANFLAWVEDNSEKIIFDDKTVSIRIYSP